jgi:hypothetical protein
MGKYQAGFNSRQEISIEKNGNASGNLRRALSIHGGWASRLQFVKQEKEQDMFYIFFSKTGLSHQGSLEWT